MNQTLVSIILPTYNGSRFLKRSIESVIAQTYSAWELLIIDDGSTDGSFAIVAELQQIDGRIRYLKNENNLGIQKALNKGVNEARGVYIARIDDDDVWLETDKLERQIGFLEENPLYVLVGTGVIQVDEQEQEVFRYVLPEKDTKIRRGLLVQNRFVHSSVVFRKDIAIALGGYNESPEVRHVEDYDLWLRMGTKGMFANLPMYGIMLTLQSSSISGINKINQFYKNITLIRKYESYYPGGTKALLWGYARIFVYRFLINSPLKGVIKWAVRFYKKFL